MKAYAISALAVSLLAGACRTEGPSRAEMADVIGHAVAERLARPIERAATADNSAIANEILSEASEGLLVDPPLPESVARVIAASGPGWLVDRGFVFFSMILVVVPHDGESRFCMVLAMASDGRVLAIPDLGRRSAAQTPSRWS